MGRQPLAETWHFIDEIGHAKTATDVAATLMRLAARYGCSTAFGGVIPSAQIRPEEWPDFILIQRFSDEWAKRYNRKGYLFRDPILYRLQIDATRPFTWDDAYKSNPYPQNVKLIDNEARAFGMHEGVVIPIDLLDRCPVAVSFGGERLDYSPEDLNALSFATAYAIGQILHFKAGEGHEDLSLTRREADCLAWAAEGKTDWEIAIILGIAAPTVEKHILAVRTKLGAVTRGHAIAKAFRLGLIR